MLVCSPTDAPSPDSSAAVICLTSHATTTIATRGSYTIIPPYCPPHHHTTPLTTPPHHHTITGKNHHVGISYGTWGSAQPSLCAFSTTHHGFCCGPAWANLLTFSRGVENKSLFTPDQAQMTHQGPAQQTHELPCGKTL